MSAAATHFLLPKGHPVQRANRKHSPSLQIFALAFELAVKQFTRKGAADGKLH
jgi:hypothetical protein